MREGPSKNYVITGRFCSGKTGVIKELARRGYAVVPEAATLLMEEYRERRLSIDELRRDPIAFQDKVFRKYIELDATAPKEGNVFFDRSAIDGIGYSYATLGSASPELVAYAKTLRFKCAFFLEPLPAWIYERKYRKGLDKGHASRLNRLLLSSYEELGIRITRVPMVEGDEGTLIQWRTDFILSNISPQK